MFEIGFTEILLVLIVALVVIGPERLPGAVRTAGLWIGRLKRFVASVRSDIEREFQADELKRILSDQEKEITELREMMRRTETELRNEVRETARAVHDLEEKEHPSEVREAETEAGRPAGGGETPRDGP